MFPCLLEPHADGPSQLLPLRSSQVDQVEPGLADIDNVAVCCARLDEQRKDRVGAAAFAVQRRLGNVAVARALLEQDVCLVRVPDHRLAAPLDPHAPLRVLAQVAHGAAGVEQVVDGLVVDLHVRAPAHKRALSLVSLHPPKDPLKDARDQPTAAKLERVASTQALHRECLARARLSVRKDRSVVALQHVVCHRHRHCPEDPVLLRLGSRNAVIHKGFLCPARARPAQQRHARRESSPAFRRVDLQHARAAIQLSVDGCLLAANKRPNAQIHTNVFHILYTRRWLWRDLAGYR